MSIQICLTRSLFVINIISLVSGACAIVTGVYQYSVELFDDTKVHKSAMNSAKDNLSIFDIETIIIGTTICLVSIFGLISAATKSTFCLKLYAAMNVMIIGGLIITSSIGFLRFEGAAEKLMEKFIAINFNGDKYNERNLLIDDIQWSLNCCGNTGIENYAQAEIFPSTCCSNGFCTLKNAYDGCNTKIPEIVNMYRWPVFDGQKILFIAIAVIAGVIELLEVMLALSIIYFSN